MNKISIPASLCQRKFLEKSLYSFYIGKDKVAIFSLVDYLTYIRSHLYSKMNKEESFKKNTFKKWFDYFYKLQKGNESSYLYRFLSKEILLRYILLEKFYSNKLITNEIDIMKDNINDTEVIETLGKELKDLKRHNVFFNTKFYNRCPEEEDDISPLNYFINLILGMPFTEIFYKEWVKCFDIYNLGE